MNNRLGELDAIRGIAAIFVLLYHYCYRYYQIYPENGQPILDFKYGHYGVEAFFLVSGFVIFMTLQKTTKSIDFVAHRFIRLFPTYWISILITFIFISIFTLPGREVTFVEAILNISMIHTQFGIKSVDGVYWTLLYELKFYFLMFLLLKLNFIKSINNIAFVIMLIIFFFNVLKVDFVWIDVILRQIFISKYLHLFVSGIMFYQIYAKKRSLIVYVNLFIAFIISIYTSFDYTNTVIMSIIYFVFLLLSLNLLRFFAIKPLVFLGAISYPLYLTHQNIGYIILNKCAEISIPFPIAFFMAFFALILIASIITYFFEKNIINYLKLLYSEKVKKNA